MLIKIIAIFCLSVFWPKQKFHARITIMILVKFLNQFDFFSI